jgi:hypothetical protein
LKPTWIPFFSKKNNGGPRELNLTGYSMEIRTPNTSILRLIKETERIRLIMSLIARATNSSTIKISRRFSRTTLMTFLLLLIPPICRNLYR